MSQVGHMACCLNALAGMKTKVVLYKSGDSYVVVETKNNEGLHFCTTESTPEVRKFL